jgi:beta-lactam-binding protein with PASTA domain
VALPPTDPRYVDGAPGGRVPDVSGLTVEAARQRIKDDGFQVADHPNPVNSYQPNGAVVGTTPSGQTIPGSIVTINVSNGVAPAPPPAPVQRGPIREPDSVGPGGPSPQPDAPVIQIPGLPPITLGPPAPAPPPPESPG